MDQCYVTVYDGKLNSKQNIAIRALEMTTTALIISQWLVAGSLDMNPSGTSLIARQTTCMPKIPSLCPILVMMFSPRVEVRTDAKQAHFTGFIAGLGTRPKKWHEGGQEVN